MNHENNNNNINQRGGRGRGFGHRGGGFGGGNNFRGRNYGNNNFNNRNPQNFNNRNDENGPFNNFQENGGADRNYRGRSNNGFRGDRGGRGNGNNDGNENRGHSNHNQQRDGGNNNRGNNANKPFSDEVASYGISYQKIEEICKAMDEKKILSGSSDLLIAVQNESFTRRLDDLWPHLDKKVNFLRVVVATASTNQADLMSMTYKFVSAVLKSKLIGKLVDEQICPMPYDPRMQGNLNIKLADYIVKLLLLGFTLLPTNMDIHLPKVQNVISSLQGIKNILSDESLQNLERLEIALKDRHEAKAAQRSQQSQPRKRENREFEGSSGEPPMDFRQLSVVPTPEDIGYDYRPYLRPARKKGRYDNDEHYLDVQFRLLREDLIRPLREGIAAYQKEGARGTDLYVYKDVELGASTMHQQTGELISYAQLKVTNRMRWDKRLKYGSLVCLSSDEFQNVFLFATVLDRDPGVLAKAKIGLKFEEMSKVNTKWKYKMVESPAFFEAYKHVMMALQALEPNEPIPFSNYLVAVNTNPQLPAYLQNKLIDFKSLIKPKYLPRLPWLKLSPNQLEQYLKPRYLGMDQSQFDALLYALTTDLAIIQGPPGTGKTFMGLQLAKLLFDNWEAWNPPDDACPMLVVCYTNHALDQFLEGISKFVETGIIRVGGRCKNPALEQFMLSKMRQWNNPVLRGQFYRLRQQIGIVQNKLEEESATLKELETRLVNPESLYSEISNSEKPWYHQSRELVWQVANLKEQFLFRWLTQTHRNSLVHQRDIPIIRQLMAWRINEIKAKNALARAYYQDDVTDALGLFNKFHTNLYRQLSQNRLLEEARRWPTIIDVDEVMKMGFEEPVAVELLIGNNVVNIRAEYNRTRAGNATRDFVNITIPQTPEAGVEEMEVDAAEFKDDDEDNRMIVDTNILEEAGFETQDKKGKNEAKKGQTWFNPDILKHFITPITTAPAMTEVEAMNVHDIWDLSLQSRWRLYQYWIGRVREKVKDQLKELEEKYSEQVKQLTELRSLSDVDVLKHAKVVGMTTTGAAKHQGTLRALRPRIVIVEEAAEVLEAHLVASLTQACQHLILIGDHKQLRPNPAVYDLARRYNFDISLFERLVENEYPHRMLENQHRMAPIISRTLMPLFYHNLQDDKSVYDRESVKGVTKNLMFINHSNAEVLDKEFKSHKNPYEANYALWLARYFLQQTYLSDQITILCTYLDQLLELRKKSDSILGHGHGINIQSVDNYQGEESDIIILSLVRSNNPDNKIGFLSIPNRVCVALSRAKMGLYVLANLDFLAEKCDLWNKIKANAKDVDSVSNDLIVKCQMHGKEQTITHYKDFDEKCREGGCDLPCNARLECGHTCVKPCHVEDMDHAKYKCQKPCQRKCASGEFQHPCKKDCWKECGDCKVKVPKSLPCGHQKIDLCHLKPENVTCVEACYRMLPCGHQCDLKCGSKCTTFCKKLVKRHIPGCNHIIEIQCSANLNNVKCNAEVEKQWQLCKHSAKAKCSDDVNSILCKKPCNIPLTDCGHLCKGTCGECRNGRIHIPCDENCKKILICGHECVAKCSKVCPPCFQPCETACGHSQCGKLAINGEKLKKLRSLLDQPKQGGKKDGGRKCGEPCPPCSEPCLNQCEHRQCEQTCGEPCLVKPCSEPCGKQLPCDPRKKGQKIEDADYIPHLCIGVCGDDCPKICKICKPEKFAEITEIFFGNEEDEDARFVQLKDCWHILEVNGLDQWIESLLPDSENTQASTEIVKINCPKCKTPICKSKRYVNLLNQRATDIENIKLIIRGLTTAEKKKEKEKFIEEVKISFEAFDKTEFGKSNEVKWLKKVLSNPSENILTKGWFTTARNILKIMDLLSKYENRAITNLKPWNTKIKDIKGMPMLNLTLNEQKINDFWEYLKSEFNYLVGRINPTIISEAMVQQIAYETMRFGFLVEFFSYLARATNGSYDLSSQSIDMLNSIFNKLNGNKEFDDKIEKALSQQLTDLAKFHQVSNFGISPQERLDIVKAMGGHVTRWYKCPNGHHYGIGECGGAVMESKCPECEATIGGGSHRIHETNQDAHAEMLQGTGQNAQPWVNEFAVRHGREW